MWGIESQRTQVNPLNNQLKGGEKMEAEQTQKNLDNWDGVLSNYLKASDLEGTQGSFVVHEIFSEDVEGKTKLHIKTNINGLEYDYIPNYTALTFLKKNVSSPKELIGKVLSWEKVRVRNPQTNAYQDGIGLTKVE